MQRQQKFEHFSDFLYKQYKNDPFSISFGFEFETNKLSILDKKGDTLHLPTQREKTRKYGKLIIGTDAALSVEMTALNKKISKYPELTIYYLANRKKKYFIRRQDQKPIYFTHTEFEYLDNKNISTTLEHFNSAMNKAFKQAVNCLNDYFQNLKGCSIYIFDKNRLLNKELNLNMILENKEYNFITSDENPIDFKTQLTIGCHFKMSLLIMLQLYKMYSPDYSKGFSFHDAFMFVLKNNHNEPLDMITFLVIFLYNFLIHQKRGYDVFFIRTYMFNIYSVYFDQDQQKKLKTILNGQRYVDFIQKKNQDLTQYIRFMNFLSAQQSRNQVQNARWKTMIPMTESKEIFFEFRGFDNILSERIKIIYPK